VEAAIMKFIILVKWQKYRPLRSKNALAYYREELITQALVKEHKSIQNKFYDNYILTVRKEELI